jgi:acyl carrier protein
MTSAAEMVCRLIQEIFLLERLPDPELELRSLPQWDSLNHVRLVFAIEDTFGARFTPREFRSMNSVKEICALLENRCGGGQ